MWVALLVVLLLQGRLHIAAMSGTKDENSDDIQIHGSRRSLMQTVSSCLEHFVVANTGFLYRWLCYDFG
jgi:hypothetical protein